MKREYQPLLTILFLMITLTVAVSEPATGDDSPIQIHSPSSMDKFQPGDTVEFRWTLDRPLDDAVFIGVQNVESNNDFVLYEGPNLGHAENDLVENMQPGIYRLVFKWGSDNYTEVYDQMFIEVIDFHIISPSEGAIYKPGEVINISWTFDDLPLCNVNIWIHGGESPHKLTPLDGVAHNSSYQWTIPSNYALGKYFVSVETSVNNFQCSNHFMIMAVDAAVKEHLSELVPHIDRPNPMEKFANFCQQDDTWGPLYHVYYTVSVWSTLHDIEIELRKVSEDVNGSIRWNIDPIIKASELVNGPGYTFNHYATRPLCLPQGIFKIKASRDTGGNYLTRKWSPWVSFYVAKDPKFTVKPSVIKSLSSNDGMQFGASKASFNLKDKAVFIVPEKDTELQFQHREGNMWRMAAAPQLLGTRAQGVAFLKEYRFKEPGRYRYRINNGPWEEFEIKGGLSPKADKALLPAIKLNPGASATGPAGKAAMLKKAKITSLRSGQTYTPDDKIKLKADYDRPHKVDFILQQKRGDFYRTVKKVGNGNLGQLKPGVYQVGVVYAGSDQLPDKWIEFNVAEGKKLKVPPSAIKNLDTPGSSKKKIKIDLK